MPETAANPDPSPPLLEMRGIEKSFPGVRALDGVDLTLGRGEVLALLGENGAGKSTLIKALGGAHRADAGEILIDGQHPDLRSPAASQAAGIAVIYQEFNLVPDMTVRENLFLGHEKTGRGGLTDAASESAQARALFARIGIEIDPEARPRNLTVAQQQTVEIAKALAADARILIMDEPTAALSPAEVDGLLKIVRDLRADGIGIIYISHRLDEVFAACDRALVLRDGASVGEASIAELTRDRLIEMMVGRPLAEEFPPRPGGADPGDGAAHRLGPEVLRVENLGRGTDVQDVSFSLRAGEVLGISGLVGAGRTELARLIFGADHPDAGHIFLNGEEVQIRSPRDAIRQHLCLLTEDRKHQGLILIHPVLENFGLPNLGSFAGKPGGLLLDRGAEREAFARHTESLGIKVSSPGQLAGQLSGGNQQKVVLAKWLEGHSEIFLFDEPTRGIDVGAKYEIYCLINDLAAAGKAVVLISSELPEVLGMSDRILVMHEGRLRGEVADVANTTQEDLLAIAIS